MNIKDLEGKKILIVGKGVEGNAAFSYLSKKLFHATIEQIDESEINDQKSFQSKFDIAVKSPGVHPNKILIPYTTPTNIFFANHMGKIIGVTGTKGKSTTSTLIYEMLKEQEIDAYLVGNIGKASLDILDNLSDQSVTVFELSSFQLQDLKYSPNIAIMLMITSEHLDYHGDMNAYILAKRNILNFQTTEDFAVINRDYPASNESDIATQGKVYYVSRERITENGCFTFDGKMILRRNGQSEEIITTEEIKLLGKHNLENACAAVMGAKLVGVSTKNIALVLRSFSGLEHRLEFIGHRDGIDFYNDSLSTIPEAAISAIEAFDGNVVTLIAGGHDRGLSYDELGKAIVRNNIHTLILFQTSGKQIWEAVQKAGGGSIKKYDVTSMQQAVILAVDETDKGKICLLSPASASFGLFKNYKDRGNQFKQAVLQLEII